MVKYVMYMYSRIYIYIWYNKFILVSKRLRFIFRYCYWECRGGNRWSKREIILEEKLINRDEFFRKYFGIWYLYWLVIVNLVEIRVILSKGLFVLYWFVYMFVEGIFDWWMMWEGYIWVGGFGLYKIEDWVS